MAITPFPSNRPGLFSGNAAIFPNPFIDGVCGYKVDGGVIDGLRTRDVTFGEPTFLRPGLLMAKNATANRYTNWRIGVSTAALLGAGTTLALSAVDATELVRRVGTSGTFTLTGPDRASGTVSQRTVTYSAVNTTTGDVTITALGAVNQIDLITFNAASTGGNIRFTIQKPDGTFATTANAAWNATDATYLASINTQLDTSSGVVGGIVASAYGGSDTDLRLALTYSGTGYTGKSWTPAVVHTLPTGSTAATVTVAVPGSGAFAAGAVVSEVGYDIPVSIMKDQLTPMSTGDFDWGKVPDSGRIKTASLIDYPTDASFKTWVKSKLSTTPGPKFTFDDENY